MGSACSSDNSNKININDNYNDFQSIHTNEIQPVIMNTNNNENNDSQSIHTTIAEDEILPTIITTENNDLQSIHTTIDEYEIQPAIENTNIIDLLNWKASIKIHRYHWWPMKETNKYALYNNLYADNGGLDKYDTLMSTKSKEYQMKNYYRSNDSTSEDANWAGFCDKSTMLSCLYEYPKHQVTVLYNNKQMLFTAFNIEALMIIASENAINNNRGIFMGERNNSDHPTKNNKSEPLPSELLEMLNILCTSNTAFAMDIDSGPAVWNYSYDSVDVKSYSSCELQHDKPSEGNTRYLNFNINSTAYPDKNQNIWGYINTDKKGTMSEAWITNEHPDFIWKQYPKKYAWKNKCIINPEVNANIVYKIYQQSLDENAYVLEL